jgi:hypothetical protein
VARNKLEAPPRKILGTSGDFPIFEPSAWQLSGQGPRSAPLPNGEASEVTGRFEPGTLNWWSRTPAPSAWEEGWIFGELQCAFRFRFCTVSLAQKA